MRKKIAIIAVIILVLAICVFALASCNYQFFDTKYNFTHAILKLPNGDIVEGKVDSWRDYEDGDQIQVKIKGITYLVHSTNVVLMDK